MPTQRSCLARAAVLACALLATLPASADDGVVLIDQAKAMAGGVTPGDEPGWPVRLTKSGSYRLSSDLRVAAPQARDAVISVQADHVSIDLNGFGIYGPNQCHLNNAGVAFCTAVVEGSYGIVSQYWSTRVSNGRVRGMGGIGIALGDGPTGDGAGQIDNVDVSHSGRTGVVVISGTVRNSSSSHNGAEGFVLTTGSLITGSRADSNAWSGIKLAGSGGLASGNIATRNRFHGIWAHGSTIGVLGNVSTNNQPANFYGGGADLGGNLLK